MLDIKRMDNVSEAKEINFIRQKTKTKTKQNKNSWGKFMLLIGKGRHALVDVCVCQ